MKRISPVARPAETKARDLALSILHSAVRTYRKLPFPRFKDVVRRVWQRHETRQRGRVAIATIGGIAYELHLNELIDREIYYKGSFEPDTTAAIDRICRNGDVVVDAGANIGCHTLRMAQRVGGEGRVFAFEPMPWARGKLTRNVALNDFQNVTIVGKGLSDAAGEREVHFRSSWKLVAGREQSVEAAGSADRAVVEFVRLDDYAEEHAIARIDVLKVDVDGYEFKVLRGAQEVLRKYKPSILLELGAYTLEAVGDSLHDMVTFLEREGYRFFDESTFKLHTSTRAMIASVPPRGTINVVAVARNDFW